MGALPILFIVRVLRASRMVWLFPPIPSELAHLSLHRAAWLILDCARRTRPFRGRAFREQEDDQAASRLPSPIEGRLTEHLYRRSIIP
jgi:hypothetical protein